MADPEEVLEPTPDESAAADPRSRAIARIQARRHLWQTGAGFVAVSKFLVAVWALTRRDVFWPAFPIAALGFAFAAQAWSVYGRERGISGDAIQREMARDRDAR